MSYVVILMSFQTFSPINYVTNKEIYEDLTNKYVWNY